MKFLADVNIERAVIVRLRADGHAVHWLAESALDRELEDPLVLALAYRESSLFLTSDREFVGYVFRDQLPAHGVVLVRVALDRAPYQVRTQRVVDALGAYQDQLPGTFTTVYPDHVEQTPLPPRPPAS